MRIHINLASERYEVAQHALRQLRLLIASMAVLALLLGAYILYQRSQTREIDAKIRQARQEITELDNEKAQAQSILNKPVNRGIADQSQFLNELFARKSLSWTQVFSVMERIMPPNLHVVSMKPEYTTNNELVVHMVVATDSRERAVELVQRIEKSTHFRNPQIVAENVTTNASADQGSGPGNIQFDIASVYVPEAPEVEEEKPEKDKGTSPEKSTAKKPSAREKAGAATTAQNAGRTH